MKKTAKSILLSADGGSFTKNHERNKHFKLPLRSGQNLAVTSTNVR